jgi:hypothetical protein
VVRSALYDAHLTLLDACAQLAADDGAQQQGGEGDGCVDLAALAALLARLGVDGASTSALEQLFRLTDSHSRRHRRAGASNEGPSNNQGRRLSYASVREVLGTSVAGAASVEAAVLTEILPM